mmetsp:Transcript_18604/g.22063  ORF Transcript_18604/g.22063 Transcript_18604/m.22063 type:complete len:412 (+) Transcript_18604:95-1330(+)
MNIKSDVNSTRQYLAITAVLFFFTLIYGYLQEMVCIHLFERQYALFLTFAQFLGYTIFAALQRMHFGSCGRRTIPTKYCIGLAISQAAMQTFSNMAMHYLNYPAKVLFKSCRVIPTMLFGVFVCNKKYSKMEWIAMFLLVSGLIIFMQADMHTSPDMNPMGVILIVLSLLLDAGILNIQEYCFSTFGCDEDELVMASYSGGSIALLLLCIGTGELKSAITFIKSPMVGSAGYALTSLIALSTCGFCGVVCVTALTRRFGALIAALTTTVRKALTLVISFTLFPNPVEIGHIFGGIIFIIGILIKAMIPKSSKSSSSSSSIPDHGILLTSSSRSSHSSKSSSHSSSSHNSHNNSSHHNGSSILSSPSRSLSISNNHDEEDDILLTSVQSEIPNTWDEVVRSEMHEKSLNNVL